MKKTALILLSLALLWHAAPALPAENTWLIGTWELYHDPDGDPKDWIEFTPDGKAVSYVADGRNIHGEYVVKESEITIVYTYNGHSIPLSLKSSPDKKQLFHYSERTHHTSEYRKVK